MGLILFAFFEKFVAPILTSGGYVGLSIATLLSQHHKVMAVDIVPEKVELINSKKSPIQDEYMPGKIFVDLLLGYKRRKNPAQSRITT